jgi:hypothetical protein
METNRDPELLKEHIRTALRATLQDGKIDEQYVEWFSEYLGSIASALSVTDEAGDFKKWFKSEFTKESSEYDQDELKWIRYRQAQSKTIDDIVKRKDELARSIKEGKIDLDKVMNSAAEGDVRSLITILPHFDFAFRRYEPSWWERFIIFFLRRKVDTNPS